MSLENPDWPHCSYVPGRYVVPTPIGFIGYATYTAVCEYDSEITATVRRRASSTISLADAEAKALAEATALAEAIIVPACEAIGGGL